MNRFRSSIVVFALTALCAIASQGCLLGNVLGN